MHVHHMSTLPSKTRYTHLEVFNVAEAGVMALIPFLFGLEQRSFWYLISQAMEQQNENALSIQFVFTLCKRVLSSTGEHH